MTSRSSRFPELSIDINKNLNIDIAASDSNSDSCASPKGSSVKINKNTPTPVMAKNTASKKESEFPLTEPVQDVKSATSKETDIDTEDDTDLLRQFCYIRCQTITKTLQGDIFVADQIEKQSEQIPSPSENALKYKKKPQVVIKKTSKQLHREHITIQNGRKFGIYENILKECVILKHLTENKNGLIMTSFTKYVNFFDSPNYYFLAMEHGGSDLFDFIIEAHQLIQAKKLKIKEWRKFAKYLFWQIVVVMRWLHVDMNTCHLDISLENILIKNGNFVKSFKNDEYYTVDCNVQIKICDFGLAEIFDPSNTEFKCKKFCGKTNYKSPEVYHKKGVFDARKADVWSLGVVLFCMLVGSPPYNKPIDDDQAFLYIKSGIIDQLLFQWERNHFITVKVLNLLHAMFKYNPSGRILMDDIIKHEWLSLYYNKYKYQMQKKSKLQQQKNKRIKPRLPFYKLPRNISNISAVNNIST